jgi:DNA polymerase V
MQKPRINNMQMENDAINNSNIDLNKQFINNQSTSLLRMNSNSLSDVGIYTGDVLIVDRSLKAENGKIVVALLNGEMLVRRIETRFNKIRLYPETKKLSPIDVDLNCCEFSIWGVVTYAIHTVK